MWILDTNTSRHVCTYDIKEAKQPGGIKRLILGLKGEKGDIKGDIAEERGMAKVYYIHMLESQYHAE